MCDNARHADGLPQLVMKIRLAPTRGAVGSHGHDLAVGLGGAAGDEHHPAVGEFGHHRLVGTFELTGVRHRDVARTPRPAAIVAVNGTSGGRPVVPDLAVSEPHRDDQPARLELNAVARAGGDDLPVVVAAERFEGRGDFHRLAPRDAIVGAPHGKAARVVHAVEELDRTGGAIDHRHGVVDRLLVFAAGLLARVALNARAAMRDLARSVPRASAVQGTAQVNFNLAPVGAAVFPRLAVSEDGALGRDHDAGNSVARDAVGRRRKHLAELEPGSGDGGSHQAESKQRRDQGCHRKGATGWANAASCVGMTARHRPFALPQQKTAGAKATRRGCPRIQGSDVNAGQGASAARAAASVAPSARTT